jgi:hypothetical protein
LLVRLAAFAVVVAAVVALSGGLDGSTGAHGAPLAVSQTLDAGFDADGNIYLTFADGTRIGNPTPPGTLVPAGTYTIDLFNNSLDDLGNPHSFHLMGPGVNLSAGGVVQATWTATFLPGSTYVFQDDDNPSAQHEVFGTSGSGATSTTPTVATTPGTSGGPATPGSSGATQPTSNNPLTGKGPTVQLRGTLAATVVGGTPTLRLNGKAVSTLISGRYRLTVVDSSTTAGFTIQEAGQPATTVTGVPFVGRRTVTIELAPGQWFFYPSFLGRKTYFVVIR